MPSPIPPEDITRIRLAIRDGNKIEAIKLLREATGLGLAEAKDAIENFERNPETAQFAPRPSMPASVPPPAVLNALMAGKEIEAIRLYREAHRVGLKEAKEAVEQIVRDHPGMPASVQKTGCLGLLVACALPIAAFAIWRALA